LWGEGPTFGPDVDETIVFVPRWDRNRFVRWRDGYDRLTTVVGSDREIFFAKVDSCHWGKADPDEAYLVAALTRAMVGYQF